MVDGSALPSMESSALSSCCKAWAEVDLESMRSKLDDTGLKIADAQEQALQNRRKLAEATRDFKRSTGDTPVKGLGPLLKQYQEEIDRLTQRCKSSESAFLEVYQKLYEAPDPAPVLAAAFETASRAAELEAQNKKLSAELADYREEAASIKNQDLTIRRLEEKIRGLEAALEEKSLEVEEVQAAAVAEAGAARFAQMQEREAQLTAMLTEAQASLAAMQKLHTATQNQLFALQAQGEEELVGRQAELDLASEELDRAQERLLALEREKTALQEQLLANGKAEATGSQSTAVPLSDVSQGVGVGTSGTEEALRQELHVQREVAGRLRLEVTSLRRDLDQAHSMWEARVDGLKASLQATEQHARALEQQLAMRPTNQMVEDMRAQIRMLQAVGYNTLADDDSDSETHNSGTGGVGGAGGTTGGKLAVGSLEAMLLQKNRHLEHSLTMSKLQVVDTKSQLDAATTQITQLQSQLGEKVALIARLEEDLLESRRAWGNEQGNDKSAQRSSSSAKGQLSELLDSEGSQQAKTGGEGTGEEEDPMQSSVIRVVCGQRDRLRARCQELEEELERLRGELTAAKNQAAAAKADNIALVERLRYVHGFKAQQKGDIEVGADAERRYGRLYEEGINPFKEFQGEQRERQKSNLHVADRLMYSFGQLLFGSSWARLVTFLYAVTLHLLVVGSLMRLTHHGSGALYAHAQQTLESRHDMMGAMHTTDALTPPGDSRLP